MPGGCSRWRNEAGQVLVLFALAIPVLLGMCALVIDVGNLFVEKRSLQKAADASALAAAQRLPGVACDAACKNAVATLAGDYKGANLGDGDSDALPECSASVTSNCYRLLPSDTAAVKVEVIVAKDVSTFFGGLIGKSSYTVRARAVAAKFDYTSVEPGSTVTTPGSTIPDITIVSTVTTPGGDQPALMFAGSDTCYAINLNGAQAQFGGAIISNGGVDAPNAQMGGGPLIYADPPDCGVNVNNSNSWGTPIAQPPAGWPVPPPVCRTATSPVGVNACNPTTASLGEQIATVDGVACTPAPAADWTINAAPAPGLYCATRSISVNADFANVGLVAPTISVKGNVVGGTSLLPAYGGLLFYAYGGDPKSEVQTVTTRGSGGTFTLTFGGQTTGAIVYDASAAAVRTALEGLSSIGAGNVHVVRTTGNSGRVFYEVTFIGTLGQTNVAQMTATSSLTGSNASASVATTRDGAPDLPTASKVIDQTSSGFAFAGAVYAPFGHVDLTGSGSQALCPDPTAAGCGFIQAWTIRLAGAGANFQGLGPGAAGPPTTTTTTSIIPGSTTPGTVTTNPDVTVTTGTGSNLDE